MKFIRKLADHIRQLGLGSYDGYLNLSMLLILNGNSENMKET